MVQFTVTCSYPLSPLLPFFFFLLLLSLFWFLLFPCLLLLGLSLVFTDTEWSIVELEAVANESLLEELSHAGMFPCLHAEQSRMVHASSLLAPPYQVFFRES